MGVYISNMNMPKSCVKCHWYYECYDEHCILGKFLLRKYPTDVSEEPYILDTQRHPNCPLIEIDLVRCGECKYFDYDYGWCKRPKKMSFIAEPTDFCSYGERNEDFDPYQGDRDRDENGEIY